MNFQSGEKKYWLVKLSSGYDIGLKNKNCQMDDDGLKNNHWYKSHVTRMTHYCACAGVGVGLLAGGPNGPSLTSW